MAKHIVNNKPQTIEILAGRDIDLVNSILVEGLANLKVRHVVMIVEIRRDKNQ